MIALNRTRKILITLAAAGVLLFAAETAFNNKASEPAVAAPTGVDNRPTSFKTDPIVGSDASLSTYGLDPERIMDW
jgi:hypothetical protein